MPKPGEIRYCPELGGKATNAAFVWIPPGSFWMGDKREEDNPVHFVTISKGFWIQQNKLSKAHLEKLPNIILPKNFLETHITWGYLFDVFKGTPFRMPTEAEWEMSARAEAGHKYMWSGSNTNTPKSNNYMLRGMNSYVAEWCSDQYKENLHTYPQLDPHETKSAKFVTARGGIIHTDDVYRPRRGIAMRDADDADSSINDCGVRIIWEPQHA